MTKEDKNRKKRQEDRSLNPKALADEKSKLLPYGICTLLLRFCLFPEVLAITLEQEVEKVQTFVSGPLKTIGMSAVILVAGATAVAKGSVILAVAAVIGGGIFAYYYDWVSAGMKLTTLVADSLHLFA